MVMAYNFSNGNSLTIGGTGASSGSNRVLRGGSWNNDAPNCSVAYRNNNNPNNRNNNIGFRVVRSAQHPFIWLRGYRGFRGKGFFSYPKNFLSGGVPFNRGFDRGTSPLFLLFLLHMCIRKNGVNPFCCLFLAYCALLHKAVYPFYLFCLQPPFF
ncbi:MAG TPA: hypothetical protein DCZ76_13510 [Treponema sp.]|nr:hypothetical protein [Treponema sp.]